MGRQPSGRATRPFRGVQAGRSGDENHSMWSRRHLAVVGMVALLAGVDAFVAARAGAAVVPTVQVSAATSPDASPPHAATTTTVQRRPTVTRVRRRPKAVAKVRVAA